MASTSYLSASSRSRPPLWRRAGSFLLAIVAHIVVILLLLRLAPNVTKPEPAPPPSTFRLLPDREDRPETPQRPIVEKAKLVAGGASPRSPKPPAAAPASDPRPTTPAPAFPKMLAGGMELFDSADISKIQSQPSERSDGGSDTDGAGAGKDSGSAYGPGEGPGGQRLYNAEWYVEPSHAELAGYLPNGAPPGSWALIACRTIENYKVENCRALGESPPGSGLARAMRHAAWQFRVRPPRVGGKTMVGAWVRIKIDFSSGPLK